MPKSLGESARRCPRNPRRWFRHSYCTKTAGDHSSYQVIACCKLDGAGDTANDIEPGSQGGDVIMPRLIKRTLVPMTWSFPVNVATRCG